MSSTVAVSPAMIAAGSPGLRYKSAKTKIATTAMTGIVARMRRTIYANIGATAPTIVVPAKAGTHHSAAGAADKWIPACAGMTAVPSAPLSFLLDVPQEDHGGDDDAVEVL